MVLKQIFFVFDGTALSFTKTRIVNDVIVGRELYQQSLPQMLLPHSHHHPQQFLRTEEKQQLHSSQQSHLIVLE